MVLVPADDFPPGGRSIPPLHNAEVQAKIEEKLGRHHKMRVLAKSRVNTRCTGPESDATVEDACLSDSVRCCPGNNRLYESIQHLPGGIAKVNTNFVRQMIPHPIPLVTNAYALATEV